MNRLLHPMNDRLHVGLGTLGAVGTRLGDVLGSVGKPWVLPYTWMTRTTYFIQFSSLLFYSYSIK